MEDILRRNLASTQTNIYVDIYQLAEKIQSIEIVSAPNDIPLVLQQLPNISHGTRSEALIHIKVCAIRLSISFSIRRGRGLQYREFGPIQSRIFLVSSENQPQIVRRSSGLHITLVMGDRAYLREIWITLFLSSLIE